MYTKLNKPKVFRDPIYGNIVVEYNLILDLINSSEMQRLRRIRQLSGVSQVFHTAEHSRFAHSLGTYEMARKTLKNEKIYSHLTDYEQILLLCAALLHDIGHGPFSHAFEQVFKIPHEQMSVNIIKGKTEVNKILNKYNQILIEDICNVLTYKSKYTIITSLISSQIDIDRMDYLLRDSFFTGTKYGMIDYEKLIRVMAIHNNEIVFRQSGVHTIESYLISRYHMYWQVYYHPKARSYEVILEAIYARIRDLKESNYKIIADVTHLINTLDNEDLASYLQLDDTYITGLIKQLCSSKDEILKDLSLRFINRKLFKYKNVTTSKEINKIKNSFKDENLRKYYFSIDEVSQNAYLVNRKHLKETLILLDDNTTVPLSQFSNIVNGLIESGQKVQKRVFFGEFNEE